jgi:dienelactone hydrolase
MARRLRDEDDCKRKNSCGCFDLKPSSQSLEALMPLSRRFPRTTPFARFAETLTRSRQRSMARFQASRRAILRNRALFRGLLCGGLITLVAIAAPFSRAHLQAAVVLKLVSGQPVPPMLARLISEPIATEEISIATPEGSIRSRLYTPTRHLNAPALVVLHGVHHLGMDEPRLVSFAAAMASCGLRVLTPELPDIKDYHVDAKSVRVIGDTTRWLAERTGGPVGVMGLSFSGGLSLVAASDPEFRPAFKFVFAVGSQGSMERVFRFYGTNTDLRPDGTTETLAAHEYGPLVLEYDYLEDFISAADLQPIRAVLRAHLYEDKGAETAALARLTPAQATEALHLMDAGSPDTRAALARAESRHIAELEGLSPGPRLAHFTTPVYLLHGAADNIIPSAETLWMASELPHNVLQAALVSPVLSHLDFGESNPTAWDNWRLIHFFALILHAAEQR